uniref:DUF7153 domain-containing protein n=1 Tax=Megaselia scalaris TaxID=36166 RepID=T1GUM6_MEGSC
MSSEDLNIVKICNMAKFQKTKTTVDPRIEFPRLFGALFSLGVVKNVFEGDDGERFEKNWLYWTGARMMYRYLPRTVGLRRISLHKSVSQRGDKMYLLICECSELLKELSSAAVLIPALRARLCGYTGLYRPIQAF